MTNSSYQQERYITFFFDIGYQNDHHKAIALLKQIFREDRRVLNADTMEIGIREFAESSVRIAAFSQGRQGKIITPSITTLCPR